MRGATGDGQNRHAFVAVAVTSDHLFFFRTAKAERTALDRFLRRRVANNTTMQKGMVGLLKRLVSRLATVVAGAMAMVIVGSTLAYAGDTIEYITFNGIDRGKITHIDDGDRFEICDIYADGYGVRGYVEKAYVPGTVWTTMGSEDDGGDPGCDYFQYDVWEVYPPWDNHRLKICWRDYCDFDYFHE